VAIDYPDRVLAVVWTAVAALAALTAAALGAHYRYGFGWSPVWPASAALVCSGGAVVLPLQRGRPWAAVFRVACWCAAGGWVAWGYEYAGITRPGYWQALLFGTLALGTLALTAAVPAGGTGGEPAAPEAPPPVLSEWAGKIDQATRGAVRGARNIVVTGWDTGAGYRVVGDCPDGVTWQVLQRFEAELAGLLNLPRGCGVSVGPGERRGGFTVDVSTVDAMAKARDYPA